MYIPAEQRRYTAETVHETVSAVRGFMHALPMSASDVGIDLDVLTSIYAELMEYRQLQAVEEGSYIEGRYDENEEDEVEDAPGAVPVCTECDSDSDVQATSFGALCWACRKEREILC